MLNNLPIKDVILYCIVLLKMISILSIIMLNNFVDKAGYAGSSPYDFLK